MATANSIFSIHEISLTEVLPLRSSVLRAGQSLQDCRFIQDGKLPALHYGLQEKEELLAVASFYRCALTDERIASDKYCGTQIAELKGCQLRGMAVETARQNKGLGRALLNDSENQVRQKWQPGKGYIWCYAELQSIGFYERMGFKKLGAIFDMESVGKLQTMIKLFEQ